MKKFTLLVALALLISTGLSAQKFYVRLSAGPALSTYSPIWGEYNYEDDVVTAKRVGLGNGIPAGAAFGINFSKYVAFEIGVNHFFGFATKFEDVYSTATETYWLKGNMLSILPSIVITPGLDKINPYARFGFLGGVFGSVTEKFEGEGTIEGISYTEEYLLKDYGGICIGAQSALGIEFKLNPVISIFAEAQLTALSYAPKKGEYITYEYNGEDVLDNMDVKDKEWEYVKDLDLDEQIPDTDPDKELAKTISFSNYGLMIGIKFNIGTK
jgi:hypothetical protein